MGRVQLHPVFDGRFLIREPDLHIWGYRMLAAQEEGYQTRVLTVNFFAHSVVVWCAAVVKQLQTSRASVPRPRCAVDTQVVFPFESSLSHAVIQHILLSWADPFERARVHCQQCALRDENRGFIALVRPILVEGQVSLCIVISFYAQCLNFFIGMKRFKQNLQVMAIRFGNRTPDSVEDKRIGPRTRPHPGGGTRSKGFSSIAIFSHLA